MDAFLHFALLVGWVVAGHLVSHAVHTDGALRWLSAFCAALSFAVGTWALFLMPTGAN